MRNDPERAEDELYDVGRAGHGHVERSEQEGRRLPAVGFAINVRDRKHDEVGEQERATTPPSGQSTFQP